MPCPLWYVAVVFFAPYQDTTIKQFLVEQDVARRKALIKLWFESKLSELGIINVTSALFIAVICSAFSWYDTTASPWSTLACWTGGLIFALGSLGTAVQQTLSLNHLKAHPEPENEIRDFVGHGTTDTSGKTVWAVTYSNVYILQLPVMMLKLSVILFLVGMGLTVWDAAIRKGFRSAEAKIAIVFTVALVFVALNYIMSSVGLYRKTSKAKIV